MFIPLKIGMYRYWSIAISVILLEVSLALTNSTHRQPPAAQVVPVQSSIVGHQADPRPVAMENPWGSPKKNAGISGSSEWFFDRNGLEKMRVFEVYDGPLRAILPGPTIMKRIPTMTFPIKILHPYEHPIASACHCASRQPEQRRYSPAPHVEPYIFREDFPATWKLREGMLLYAYSLTQCCWQSFPPKTKYISCSYSSF